ncbi:AIPR family protein [Bacillus sp. OK048]|uniref:AIPR family protein n=1 Tax=Bacillus sp. OK048 TaxID=1882761 RepID=UPI00088B9D7E|nr:AIPR family protein [Bacillus sp. OK048]SDN61886.1 AIPR protein [Bacillus sp. OK048]
MSWKTISLDYLNAVELENGYIVMTTKTSALKDVVIPLGANPRKPSKKNKNVKSMITQLENDPSNFRKKNEGISIIAYKAVIDKETRKVIFEVNERQGIINGGHTYFVLNQHGVADATVRIEINTGVPDELTAEIASSRNSSKKLSSESELNHIGMFEWIKESVSPELRSDISFHEGDDGSIEVGELLQVVNIISPNKSTIENAKRSYNSKGAILGSLKNHKMNASIVRTRNHIEEMWELYNYIRNDQDLKERFMPMIYEGDQMYKGVAFFILAGVLQKRTEIVDGYVIINTSIEDLKKMVHVKADAVNNKIMRLGQHFVGAIDSMVASDTFVDGIEVVFLK